MATKVGGNHSKSHPGCNVEGGLKGLVSLGKETGEVYPAEAQVRGDGGLSSGEREKGQKPSCPSTFLLETSGIYHLVPA